MNKIIVFVVFVIIASVIYYAYDTYTSIQEQLVACVSTKNSLTNVIERDRTNCDTKTRNYENSLMQMVRDLNEYKGLVTECDGKIAAEKQTCAVTLQNYYEARNQLKMCSDASSQTTTTTTIQAVTTTTQVAPTNSTK